MKSVSLRALCAMLAWLAPAAVWPEDPFTSLPPPLVDTWAVSLRALGAPDDAAAPIVDSPEAPPAATFEQQIAELVNNERAICTAAGCPAPPLKLVPLLTGVADGHSASMAVHDYFSHCDFSTGLDPFERMVAAGYGYYSAAENIAAGNSTPLATMAQWMASAGHRANILSTGFRELGVGYFQQSGDQSNIDLDINTDCDCGDQGESCSYLGMSHYWTQVFGMRTTVYPLIIEGEDHLTATGTVDLYVHGPAAADDMRFSNDGVVWSAWQAFGHTKVWTLAAGSGLRTVFSQVRNGSTVYRGCDQIWRTGGGGTEIFADSFDCDGSAAWSAVSP
jgi:uncharacterized protein YkwD